MFNTSKLTAIFDFPCLVVVPDENLIDKTFENVYTFRCTRPILGDNAVERGFIFYTEIDLQNGQHKYNHDCIINNAKMDARVLFFATEKMQSLMAIAGTKYVDRYLAMDEDHRLDATRALVNKLNHKTFGELCDMYDAAEQLKSIIENKS